MPKKITSENINNKLSLVMKSGKATLGTIIRLQANAQGNQERTD